MGVQNLVAPTAPAPPAAPVANAVPAPYVPPPVIIPLIARIAPLRLDAEGVHRLTVNLHPADLGPVQVVAEIRNGEISVRLSGATEAGHGALRDALADLKRDLEDSGFTNCTLDLRQGDAQQEQAREQFGFQNESRAGRDPGGRSAGDVADAPESAPARPAGTGTTSRLDVEA